MSLDGTGLLNAAAGLVLGGLAGFLARELWIHWTYPLRGRLYWRWRHPDLAAAAWRAYLATWTLFRRGKADARLSLAQCLHRLDRPAEALVEVETLLASPAGQPYLGLAQRLRADLLAKLGRDAEAAEARAASELLEDGSSLLYSRELEVDRLESEGAWEAALEQLELLIQAALRDGTETQVLQLRLRLANMRLRFGFYDAAMMAAEAILGRAGLSTEIQHDAHLVAARAYLEQERLEQAERDGKSAFRISNLASDTEKLIDDCLTLAEIAFANGDYVAAMENYQRVRECGGNGRWLAAAGEAQVLAFWGRRNEMAAAFAQARRNLPTQDPARESATMFVAIAEAMARQRHEPELALDLLRPHLAAAIPEPRLELRRDGLVVALAAMTGEHDLAGRFAPRLAAGREAFAHDRHLLVELDLAEAELAAARGDLEAAVARLREALERPPQGMLRPGVQLRLAELEAAAGQDGAAAELLREVAAFDPAIEPVMAARERLQG